jgi:acyl carrier protein
MDVIIEILQEIRPDSDFITSSDFIEQGLLDSMDIVVLVATLDEKFKISIDGTDIVAKNFSNIENIKSLLIKKGVEL